MVDDCVSLTAKNGLNHTGEGEGGVHGVCLLHPQDVVILLPEMLCLVRTQTGNPLFKIT